MDSLVSFAFRIYRVNAYVIIDKCLNNFPLDDAEKVKRLEADLEESRKQQDDLKQDCEKKDKRMKMLEQKLKAQEKKFQDELKAKNVTINTLKRELDSKSNNIAFLTTEMHRMKKRVGAEEENLSENMNSPTVIPIPPRDGGPRVRRSLYKKGEGLGVTAQPTVMVRRHMRGSSGKSVRSNSPVEIPDPAPFLVKNSAEKREVRIKPTPPPLPPIAAPVIHGTRHSAGHVLFRSARQEGRGGGPVRALANSSPEVETLAVDQVPGTTGKWGRAHESRSSEYN